MVRRLIFGVLVVAVLAIGASGVWYSLTKGGLVKPPELQQLAAVEVKQYEGKNLSSVKDFRENSIKGPQHVDISTYQLKIGGLVNKPVSFTYDQIIGDYKHYRKMVRLDCVEGWNVNILWEGMLVKELVLKAQPKPEAKVIIFKAYDGYSTSFPIDYIMNNDIIMAYKMNDITMPADRGYPFQLVAEMKWGYKWIKWITEIELSDNEKYEGYWESRGYSNTGDLDKSFFDF